MKKSSKLRKKGAKKRATKKRAAKKMTTPCREGLSLSDLADVEDLSGLELADLAQRVRDANQEAERFVSQAVAKAWHVGRLLLAAKARVRHGDWVAWVEKNCDLSARQASKYVKIARAAGEMASNRPREAVLDSASIREALAAIAPDPPEVEVLTKPDPVAEDEDDQEDVTLPEQDPSVAHAARSTPAASTGHVARDPVVVVREALEMVLGITLDYVQQGDTRLGATLKAIQAILDGEALRGAA